MGFASVFIGGVRLKVTAWEEGFVRQSYLGTSACLLENRVRACRALDVQSGDSRRGMKASGRSDEREKDAVRC